MSTIRSKDRVPSDPGANRWLTPRRMKPASSAADPISIDSTYLRAARPRPDPLPQTLMST